MEGWVNVHKVAHARSIDANTISVAIIRAIFFRAIAASVSSVTLALSIIHATSVKATLVLAGGDATVGTGPAFFALALTVYTISVTFAVIRAALLGTIISTPHLAFKCGHRFLYRFAFALSSVNIAISMFNKTNAA